LLVTVESIAPGWIASLGPTQESADKLTFLGLPTIPIRPAIALTGVPPVLKADRSLVTVRNQGWRPTCASVHG
jgi:hypothetical protein